MANEHSGHRDRLRERYLSEGLDSFAPHNVLELLLFYSVPRRDTNVLAHRLIEQFGSLVGVLNAGVHLHLVADIARRYYAEAIAPPPNDARREDLMRYYGQRLVAACNGLPEETLYLVCLDNNLREISTDRISTGAPNAVQLPGRRIAEVALRHHAPSILLAHNHPRGIAIPSREDVAATLSLRDALRAISVELIDHFVIAGSDYVSMAQSGFFSSAARTAFSFRSPGDETALDCFPDR